MRSYSFENILAWQKAHDFTVLVYKTTRAFPEDEKFGLTLQFLLSRDLEYITIEQFNLLQDTIENTSKFLNSYCAGIINNNGIKDNK